MNRLTVAFLASLVWLVATPALAQDNLQRAPDNSRQCDLYDKGLCYHVFESTDTAATTADTYAYEVGKCDLVTVKFDGDGSAKLFVKECSSVTTSGSDKTCVAGDTSVFTDDMDNDGDIDAVDEGIELDGTAGKRGFTLPPRARWHFVDVQTLPASGAVHVTIICQQD